MMGHDFINIFYGPNDATNFTAQLLRLIAKADWNNRERLREAFPREVALYDWWMNTPQPPDPEIVMVKARELAEGK